MNPPWAITAQQYQQKDFRSGAQLRWLPQRRRFPSEKNVIFRFTVLFSELD
jgi:hypothetical protein